jgi:drug/metabolite transporter (DMT)-like permease
MRLNRYDAGLLVVSIIWGGNYSVAKLVVGETSPVVFAAIRYLTSSALLWLIVWRSGRASSISRRTTWILLGWGVIGHTLNQLTFLYGLRHTSPTNSALIFSNLPVVVAALGVLFGIERPSPRTWAGIALGTIGVGIVIAGRGTRFEAGTLLGDFLSVAALLFWALFTVGVRRAAIGVNSVQVSAITHLGGTPGLVLAAVPVVAGSSHSPFPIPHSLWIGVAYASVLSSAVASVLWTRSLQALGGNRTAIFNCVTPIFAALSAWIVFGERPLPIQAAGAALVVVGVLVSRHPGEVEES